MQKSPPLRRDLSGKNAGRNHILGEAPPEFPRPLPLSNEWRRGAALPSLYRGVFKGKWLVSSIHTVRVIQIFKYCLCQVIGRLFALILADADKYDELDAQVLQALAGQAKRPARSSMR